MSFRFAYIPIGVPTFHLESAQKEFDKSVAFLRSLDENVIVPSEMLLSLDKLNAFTQSLQLDFAIVQNVTFANGAYIAEVLRRFDCPVLLWTLREPVIDGTRLRLNSLTGAYSAANMLHAFGRPFTYVFGSPDEDSARKKIAAAVNAARVRKELKSLRLLQVGHTPQGFGFGRAMDAEVMTVFGSELLSIEARELINAAKAFSDDDINEYLADAGTRIRSLQDIEEKNVLDFARLYRAYDEYVKKNGIGALSSRCWPDFFVDFGTPVCAVLAILNDLGVPAACEADTYGALTMFIGQKLTGSPVFFGDPVSMNEAENTLTFWHCGMAPCSLARDDTGAVAGRHCNRHIGPTLEFGCKAEKNVTVCRVGKDAFGKFRLFICSGEALDKPQQFYGTSIVVKTKSDAAAVVDRSVSDGWEPHFVVAMGDIAAELHILADMLGIEAVEY
ncbi:MAG: fucose isomerase [Clostridia bacterium]|nr:fucose isomerase [Clostridia bacterium]